MQLRSVIETTKRARPPDWFGHSQETNAEVIDLDLEDPGADGFPVEHFTWMLGDVRITRAFLHGAPERIFRHGPRSFIDHWCVVLTQEPWRPGPHTPRRALSIRLLSKPLECCAPTRELISVFLPKQSLGIDGGNLDRDGNVPLIPALADLLSDYLLGLIRVLPTLPDSKVLPVAEATRSLVAACIAPSLGGLVEAENPAQAALIERAYRIVRENLASPEFGPAVMCRLMGVSRSKLYRLFEPCGGIARVIQYERLLEAHRRLTDPIHCWPVNVVAFDVGFSDHSTFSRAFRREFGYSPSDARPRGLAETTVVHARSSCFIS
jgi:AraC-like DNA-binding protein